MKKSCILLALLACSAVVPAQQLITDFPQANDFVRALELDADQGSVFVGGGFTELSGGVVRHRLARIDLTTLEILPFAPDINGHVQAMVRLGQTLYIGGTFTSINGQPRGRLAAFDIPTGTLLPWAPEASGEVKSMDAHGNAIYVAGEFWAINLVGRSYVAALDATTGALLPFTMDANNPVYCIRYYDGRIYIGGGFSNVNNVSRYSLAEGDAITGALTPFIILVSGGPNEIIKRGDLLYISGGFHIVDGNLRSQMACIDLVTRQVTPWHPACAGASMMLEVGDSLLVNAVFVPGIADRELHMVSLANGGDRRWYSGYTSPYALEMVMSPSKLIIGGLFNEIGTIPRNGMAAFEITNTSDNDGDGIPDLEDTCPTVAGEVGSACDDGDAWTINDQLDVTCTCSGTSIITQLTTTADPEISCNTWGHVIGSSTIYANNVPGANKYQFNFTNTTGQPAYARNIAMPTRALPLNPWATLPLKPGRTYNVKVRISMDDGAAYHDYGPSCTVRIAYPPAPSASVQEFADAELQVYPNPGSDTEFWLHWPGMPLDLARVTVEILNGQGQVVHRQRLSGFGEERVRVDVPAELSNGIYTVRAGNGEYRGIIRWVLAR